MPKYVIVCVVFIPIAIILIAIVAFVKLNNLLRKTNERGLD